MLYNPSCDRAHRCICIGFDPVNPVTSDYAVLNGLSALVLFIRPCNW
jgi:hypothetical protein